jgi:hypothetical protein
MEFFMTQQEIKVSNVGGVWNTNPHWSALYWGSGVDAGVKRLELIAEDWTFTFKTVEQKFSALNLHKRYGP